MFSNKNHLAMRNMFISSIATFVTIITVSLFLLLFLNCAGILLGAFSASVHAATYSASISAPSTVSLDVSASGSSANVTRSDINIISTCPSGYTVSIAATSSASESFSDTTLYKDGDKTNTATTKKIDTSAGTVAAPATIIGNRTWGYTTEAINGGSPVTINSGFVGLSNSQAILSSSATGTTATGTILPVYYGASIESSTEPGEYKMTDDAVITYYLITSLDCTSYQVAFNPSSTAGGQTLTGTGSMGNQRISEDQTVSLDANDYTAPTGYFFAGWNTAQDGTGTSYADGASVTNLTAVGNTITLYAQWSDCVAGNICYDDNGANSPTTMSNQTIPSNSTEITLWASNFQYQDSANPSSVTIKGFAGWNTKANGTGTSYGPNETITDTSVVAEAKTKGLKLYAMWVDSAGSLQNWTGCSSLASGAVTALTDTRDGNTYAVAKLADGKCWMIENLRLDNNHTTSAADIAKAQGYNASFIGLANPETANFIDSTTANSLYSIDGSTAATITGSDQDAQDFRFPRYNNQNTALPVANMTSSDANVYSYGNYYTWSAAIADTSNHYIDNHSISGTSICPSGWHLPSGGDKNNFASSEFWALSRAAIGADPANYGSSTRPYYTGTPEGTNASNTLRSYPNNFIYSGFFYDSFPVYGSYGLYWSSTVNDRIVSYTLDFDSRYVYPGTGNLSKYYGSMARCIVSGS